MTPADTVLFELENVAYTEVLLDHPENMAIACVNALFTCLYLNFKGRSMYIPSSYKKDLQEIHTAIILDFKGRNHKDLAIKFNVSEQTIYSVVKLETMKYIDRVQTDIFSNDNKQLEKPITISVIEDYLPKEFERCGLTVEQSVILSKKISSYLCKNFPGISIVISKSMKDKRDKQSHISIFNI